MPIFLTNDEQARCINPAEAVDALEKGIIALANGDAIRRPRFDNLLPTTRQGEWFNFSSMEGGLRDPGYWALRIKPDIYAGIGPDSPRTVTYCVRPGLYGGLVFLFSTSNAEFLAFMNDGFVQHLRVAATAALGVKYFSRPESKVLGIIGSGGMARQFPQTIAAVRDIERLQVWSPTAENLERYVADMQQQVPFDVVPVASARAVAANADILCACTTSRRPVIEASWIEPGTHLNNLTPMEFDQEVFSRVDVAGLLVDRKPPRLDGFVDEGLAAKVAALCYVGGQPEEQALLPPDATNGERFPNARYEAVTGESDLLHRYERRHEGEITILAGHSYGVHEGDWLNSAGIQGIQFATIGGQIYEGARKRGLGMMYPLAMFLQDIPT